MIPPAHGVELFEAYPGPKRCCWVAGGGHVMPLQELPGYRDRLLGFIVERLTD